MAAQMPIGAFARRSGLSPKALRLYDELGLLVPARVEPGSGYRFYDEAQLAPAAMVAALRQLQVPLAGIGEIVSLDPPEAAERIRRHWEDVEREHEARRDLARLLVDRLEGLEERGAPMDEASIHEIPSRSVLCLKRQVDGEEGAWELGKEFVALLRAQHLAPMEGRAGAAFCIYWGQVGPDGDGPLEWCQPVPGDQAAALAAAAPALRLRLEPAHRELVVALGPYGQVGPARWQVAMASLRDWAGRHGTPSDLGVRITYRVRGPAGASSSPECDFAVPID